jgi:hypothetical protein
MTSISSWTGTVIILLTHLATNGKSVADKACQSASQPQREWSNGQCRNDEDKPIAAVKRVGQFFAAQCSSVKLVDCLIRVRLRVAWATCAGNRVANAAMRMLKLGNEFIHGF